MASPLPRVVKNLGWVSLLNDISTESVYPLLPEFLKSLGAGASTLGLMEGIAESTSALLKWWSGRASDGRARKPFVLTGYALAVLSRPLLALASVPWHVVAVRTTDRVGKGLRSAPRDALVAEAVAAGQRGYAFAFHQMMDNVGAVVGPVATFALAKFAGLSVRAIFAATLIPGLFAFGTVLWGVKEAAPQPSPSKESVARVVPFSPQLRAYLGLVALFTLGASADSFLILRLNDLGLPVAWTPLAWVSLSASKALLNLPGGRLSDRLGRKRTQVAGWLVYASAYALFPFAGTVASTWALMIAYGAYYGLTEGGEKALVADLANREGRGRAFGALQAITGAAVLPANAIFGLLFEHHVRVAFWASAGCALAAAVGLSLLRAPTNGPNPI